MQRASTPPLSGERLIIVEDEILIALDMEATLTDAGAEVVGLYMTLRDALASLDGSDCTAAVLDIRLGTETSYDIALDLQERHIPYIFCSGQELSAEMRDKLPDALLLRKPVLPNDLVQGVLQAIGRR